jgi:hypothetical protein
VADDMVDRDAAALRIAAIAERRRHGERRFHREYVRP